MVFTFYLCDIGSGVVMAILSAATVHFAFLPPPWTVAKTLNGDLGVAFFLLSAGLIGLIVKHLRDYAAQSSALFENSPTGMVAIDPACGRIVRSNPVAQEMWGYDATEFRTKTIRDVTFAEDLAESHHRNALLIAGSIDHLRFEKRYRRKNGRIFWAETCAPRLKDAHLRTTFPLGSSIDITKRKTLEINLKRSNAELDLFARVVSHDLREPLRMITSYLGLIEGKLGANLSDDIKVHLADAVDTTRHMERLIAGVLQYSRIGFASEPMPVALGDPAALALHQLVGAIRDTDADITVADGLPTVKGNPVELTRLFQNLLENAVKFRAPSRLPEVEIGWRRQDNDYLVWIKDNGIGIEPAHVERAFVMFQRLVSSDVYKGMGLGLAICGKIVESHGGTIWLESTPDKGSTIFMALPVPVEDRVPPGTPV